MILQARLDPTQRPGIVFTCTPGTLSTSPIVKQAIASKLLNKETNIGNHQSLDSPKFKLQLL
jgi:hypothetical protein